MPADILTRIQNEIHAFSKGQKKIASYILTNYDKAAFMTASRLGKTVEVSESTVVRFAVELGYAGYPEMQKTLQELVRNKLTSVQRIEVASDQFGNQDVVSSVLQRDANAIRMTAEALDRAQMTRAVGAILRARCIYIVGVRSSAALANYLNFYFRNIFENVRLVSSTATSEMFEQLLRVGHEDVVIGISLPRYSSRTVKLLQYAHDSTGSSSCSGGFGMNMTPLSGSNKIVVVGGGAAGMMAAGMAAQAGAQVTLLEQNGRLGKKLLITGKGRCNVTNDCPWQDVLQSVPTNPRFLYSALAGFSPADAKKFFEDYGCALKTERGNRVFPVSDRSQSVLDALERFLRAYHVRILPRKAAEIAVSDGRVTGVKTAEGPVPADCVILATGGLSYPANGSTGSGYAMAQAIGHTIIEPTGSLVPLVEKGHDCAKMQGLALKNIAVKLVNTKGKTVYEDFGELLFTHFGLSGPVILSASAHMARGEAGYTVRIDLKPALDEKTLDARILRDFSAAQNRDFENSLSALLPRSMIPVVIARSGIDPLQKVNSITKQQRRALLETIKCFSVPIACKAPVEDAIVTSGGVKVSEVNAKTMESKLVQGLYFAGELLDVDAYTGGFNLQIAWATGRLAGLSAAAKEFQKPEDAT